MVRLLIARGAKVNDRDKAGDTALILAARYSGEASVASVLLKAGADASVRDSHSLTSCEIASKRGHSECAAAIDPRMRAVTSTDKRPLPERARQAAMLSLPLIERTTHNFTARGGCASCHHQGLGLITTGTAASLGYAIDSGLAKSEQKVVLAEPEAQSPSCASSCPTRRCTNTSSPWI